MQRHRKIQSISKKNQSFKTSLAMTDVKLAGKAQTSKGSTWSSFSLRALPPARPPQPSPGLGSFPLPALYPPTPLPPPHVHGGPPCLPTHPYAPLTAPSLPPAPLFPSCPQSPCTCSFWLSSPPETKDLMTQSSAL